MPTIGRFLACVIVCGGLSLATSVDAAEPSWGHLKARFVYDGRPAALRELPITKDIEVCGKERPLDESLLVNEKNGGVANVVVWMVVEKGQELPDEHPSYVAAAKDKVELDAVKCRFEPHISLLRTHQTLHVGNKDSVGHNDNIQVIENQRFGRIIPVSGTHKENYDRPERVPVNITCNIHPWMTARLLIQDHPYMAVSDADGKLEVRNIPVGKWKFRAWHERAGWLQNVSIGERRVNWKKGIIEAEIKPSELDLGTIKLSPEVFEK